MVTGLHAGAVKFTVDTATVWTCRLRLKKYGHDDGMADGTARWDQSPNHLAGRAQEKSRAITVPYCTVGTVMARCTVIAR